jgi:hypothetical protein
MLNSIGSMYAKESENEEDIGAYYHEAIRIY